MTPAPDPDLEQHLAWARDVRRLTEGTLRARTTALRTLGRFIGKPLRDASELDLLRWQKQALPANAATAKAYTSHVVSFYAQLVQDGILEQSPASVLLGGRRPRRRVGTAPDGTRFTSEELLARWGRSMLAGGRSNRTITDWPKVIDRVARRTGQHPAAFTTDALAGFLAALPSAATRASYWGALRSWHRWLIEVEELRLDNPMRKLQKPKEPRRRPRPVTTPQLERLLASGIRRRTRTWILLAAYQGLRVHEIAKVRGEDVDVESQTLRVIGKGDVDAVLPLHPRVAAEAAFYPQSGWWFPSYEAYGRGGEHVLGATVSITISRAMSRAGMRCTAHQLRHWFGTNTLRAAKGNLRVAQEALRHASIATTALYTKVDDTELRAAMLALPA